MSITALISTIATLALLLLLGYGGGKLKYIDETATERLSTLIVKIGQTFLIINVRSANTASAVWSMMFFW